MLQGAKLPSWLRDYNDINIEPIDALAMSNQLDTLLWMMDNTPSLSKPTQHTAEICALKGHTAVVQWLYDNYPLEQTDSVVKLGVLSGNHELIKWLYRHNFPFDDVYDWARDRSTRELARLLTMEQKRESCRCLLS